MEFEENVFTQFGNLSRGALRHQVVKHILNGVFRSQIPPGTRLIVQKLAQQFGVSSTPIREALVELESIGFIEFVHNRGAEVKPFGPKQLHEIYQIRRLLESEATRCACEAEDRSAFEPVLEEMKKLVDDLQPNRDWATNEMANDRKFHQLISEHCGSERLSGEIQRYDNLIQTCREIIVDDFDAEERALKEHFPIIEALIAGDADAAGSAMETHIVNTSYSVEKAIFGDSEKNSEA